jgi:prepilin-type N-terminal cleavage/methylation domain-containing protein
MIQGTQHMIRLFRRPRGFTLIEALMVLLATAVIAVAAVRYLKHQQEVSADQVYGQKLYTFGQAVNAYISVASNLQTLCQLPGPNGSVNPSPSITLTNCTPGGNGTATLTATGVSWLYPANAGNATNGGPFLPQDFSFAKDLTPLQMATVNPDGSMGAATGDNAIITTVTFTQISGSTPPPPTVSIQAGGLFELKGVDSKGKPLPPVLMPALTQEAISRANTFYSASQGPAAVDYAFPYLQSGGGAPKPGNLSGSLALTGIPYLEIKGSSAGGNSMMGTINFSGGQNARVTAVNNMNFVPVTGQPSAMIDLAQLNFEAPWGAINGLRTLNFAASPIPSAINSVQIINFDTNNAAPNNVITGLDTISFRRGGAGSVQGMTVKNACTAIMGANNNACDTGVPSMVNGLPSSVCFVSESESQAESGCRTNKVSVGKAACLVSAKPGGNWTVYNSGGFTSICSATCLIWAY